MKKTAIPLAVAAAALTTPLLAHADTVLYGEAKTMSITIVIPIPTGTWSTTVPNWVSEATRIWEAA